MRESELCRKPDYESSHHAGFFRSDNPESKFAGIMVRLTTSSMQDTDGTNYAV
jgi:hypothetical protein